MGLKILMTLELTQGNEHAPGGGLVVCQNPDTLGLANPQAIGLSTMPSPDNAGSDSSQTTTMIFLGSVPSPDTNWTQTRLVLIVCQVSRTLSQTLARPSRDWA